MLFVKFYRLPVGSGEGFWDDRGRYPVCDLRGKCSVDFDICKKYFDGICLTFPDH
jgi:hypothetical protein